MKKIILSLLLCFSLNAFAAELHLLVKSGKVDQVREYLKAHPEHVNYKNFWEETPLFFAQNVEIAQLLIDHGAKIDHASQNKHTPLLCAAFYGRVEVARLLIDLRANVNQVDHHGLTPLFTAAKCSFVEIVRLLLENGANIPFTVDQSEAVRRGNVPEIIQLLEGKNILTASSEVFAEFDGLMKKQLKPCVRQPNATTCMAHALKNAGLLTEYYAAEVEERKEIDKKFASQRVYDECFQSDAFASLRAIITGQDFTTLAGGRASEIGTAVFKISRTIDPKIQVVFDPNNFSLCQRDQSRKSEVVLVLSNKVHWHAIGLEEQPDGAVEISVLDSFFNHFCLEENFYRKLILWFKGGSIEQPATEQLRSRL